MMVPSRDNPARSVFLHYIKVTLCMLIMPRPGGIKRWCCLTSVCLTSVAYIRSAGGVCGWLDGAYWLIGPGLAGLAQGCRCVLPLQAWAGAYRGGCPPTVYYIKYTPVMVPGITCHRNFPRWTGVLIVLIARFEKISCLNGDCYSLRGLRGQRASVLWKYIRRSCPDAVWRS